MAASKPVSASRYVLASLALTLVLLTLIGGVNISLNLFGLYGHLTGRNLPIFSGNDRIAKYLLCRRYVPANFECLLVGNSVPRLFPVNERELAGQRVYNGGLGGGTIGEYIQMIEFCSQYPGSRLRTVILFVDPPSTQSSVAREVVSSQELDLMSLCSTFSMRLWIEYWLCRSGRTHAWYDEFGVMVPEPYWKGSNWWREDLGLTGADLAAQHGGYPLTEEDKLRLRTLRECCERNKLKLVCLAMPMPALRYNRLRPKLHTFYAEVSACLETEVLNPNESADPTLRQILAVPKSFRDGRHFFPADAARVWESCSRLMIEPRMSAP